MEPWHSRCLRKGQRARVGQRWGQVDYHRLFLGIFRLLGVGSQDRWVG